MGFNEARLHEATFNLHMREFFSPVNSISWRQAAFEWGGVRSHRIFIVRKMTGSGPYPYTQDSQDIIDSTNSYPDFMNTIITGDESWVYEYDPEPAIFLTMKIRREQPNTTSLKCYLPSTDAIGGGKFTHAYEGSRSPRASGLHCNPPGFRKKNNNIGYFSNRVVFQNSILNFHKYNWGIDRILRGSIMRRSGVKSPAWLL